jgi:RimJ/RimL family protein N-acetyltransferase
MHVMETPRLILRPFCSGDWQDFQELAVDWKAAPGPEFDKWRTTAEASRESVEHMATRDDYLAMCLRDSGKVVGLLAINGIDSDKQLDLGHVILSQYQDNDHDREALEALLQHCFDAEGAASVVTQNAANHEAQLAPLKSLGLTSKNPDNGGELVITRAEWQQRVDQ